MRSTVFLAVGMAGLTMASPLLAKKKLVYDIVTETVVVYVTAGDEPAPAATPVLVAAAPPVIVVTTSSTPVPVVVQTVDQAAATLAAIAVTVPAVAQVSVAVSVAVDAAPSPSAAPIPTPEPSIVVAPETPTSASVESFPSPTDYQSTVLYWHNVHRHNNSANPLNYNDTLASYATTVANTCVFAHDLTPGGGNYGQNIGDSGTTDPNEKNKSADDEVANAIDMWYTGEINDFPFADYGAAVPDFSNFGGWGHYSQVVWKDTTSVGCATVYCGSGDGTMFGPGWSGWYTVCNYYPAGNMGGGYATNVGKPLLELTLSPS